MRYQPKTKPFKHQARATIRAVRARNYAIFFEPRLGKSKAALDYVGILALAGHVTRVAIIGPRITLDVWEKQIDLHFPHFYMAETFDEEWSNLKSNHFNVLQISGEIPTVKFFLASREELWNKTKPAERKMKTLEKWNPDVVILDESHEYKRPGGRGAQRAWRFVRRLRKRRASESSAGSKPRPWVLLLTGTPNPKGWIDLFAPFRIMDEDILGTSAADFKERHVTYGVGKRRWKIIQYNHVKELERKVRAHSISVNAEDAGLANVQFFENLHYHLPARAKKMYLELAEEFMTEWEKGVISAANAGVKRIRLLQVCGGFTTDGEQIHDACLSALRGYTNLLLEQEESVVVYCRFTPEVEAATDAVKQLGFQTHRVDGSTSSRDRSVAIRSLGQSPRKPTAVVFQHQAGSRAIELVGAAETVYYSAPDGWVDYYQTLKRTQGPNQPRPVRYTHLVSPGTATVSVIRGLQEKEDRHASLMNNPRRYLLGL